MTAQVAQSEQTVADTTTATEKRELKSLQVKTKTARTDAMTAQELESMDKKTLTGNITLTPAECRTLKDYAILARGKEKQEQERKQPARKRGQDMEL